MMYPLIHGIVAQGGLEPPGQAWALWLMQEGSGQVVADSSGNGRHLWLGHNGTAESVDPTWTTFHGVTCLEGAGGQICVAQAAHSLSQPYSMAAIGRTSSPAHQCMIIRDYGLAANYGLARVATTKQLRLAVDAVLVDGTTPDSQWFVGIGVADGENSRVWIYGGSVTTGSAGTAATIRPTLMARWTGSAIVAGWVGQFAAAVILEGLTSEAEMHAWAEYLAAVKGITL